MFRHSNFTRSSFPTEIEFMNRIYDLGTILVLKNHAMVRNQPSAPVTKHHLELKKQHLQIQSLHLESHAAAWRRVEAAPPAGRPAAGTPASLKFCPAACATESGSAAAPPCWTRWRRSPARTPQRPHCYPAATHKRTHFTLNYC